MNNYKLLAAVMLVAIAAQTATTVPHVLGLSSPNGKRAIVSAGLLVGTVTEKDSSKFEGRILGQDPPSGDEVPTGSKVNLVVSSGIPPSEGEGEPPPPPVEDDPPPPVIVEPTTLTIALVNYTGVFGDGGPIFVAGVVEIDKSAFKIKIDPDGNVYLIIDWGTWASTAWAEGQAGEITSYLRVRRDIGAGELLKAEGRDAVIDLFPRLYEMEGVEP